jgi:hypothetical protein
MAQLNYPSQAEVQLRLGQHENEILTVVRHWAWWTRAEVEGRVADDPEVTAVILTAERAMEVTIREILHRSFQLVFPVEGGEGARAARGPGSRTNDARSINPRPGSTGTSRTRSAR